MLDWFRDKDISFIVDMDNNFYFKFNDVYDELSKDKEIDIMGVIQTFT